MISMPEAKKTKPCGAGTPNGQEKYNVDKAYFEADKKASMLYCVHQRGRSLSLKWEAA